ncbi:hypothetical protein [Pseudomonas sp. NFX98]|uniref:hypothetical protein n=1 Tax=Pseudomonas sp. NFX98 TaxID=3399122 RepID=UPI0039FCE235
MALKTLLIYWPLLSIAIVVVLCRIVHNAKVALAALEIQAPDRQPLRAEPSDAGKGVSRNAETDRRVA